MTQLRLVLLVLGSGALGAIATVMLVGNEHAQMPTQSPPPPQPNQRQWPPAIPGAHYQYQCETKWDHRYWSEGLQAQINERGKQGWRWMGPLSHANNPDVYCFERAY